MKLTVKLVLLVTLFCFGVHGIPTAEPSKFASKKSGKCNHFNSRMSHTKSHKSSFTCVHWHIWLEVDLVDDCHSYVSAVFCGGQKTASIKCVIARERKIKAQNKHRFQI